MSRRIYFDKAAYHICIRGNNRQDILGSDDDKLLFLETLSKYKKRFEFKLYSFVLMDNHAHLIIETVDKISISKIMQAIELSYSQKFRNKYKYVGYVWQGRFKSKVITGGKYILECANYIHNNPVRANMDTRLKDYKWSSYHKYNEKEDPLEGVIDVDSIIV